MPQVPLPLVALTTTMLLVSASVLALTASAEGEAFRADAGEDQIVECTSSSGAVVHLDGTDSTPNATNDSIESSKWYLGDRLLGSGLELDVTFPLGTHVVSLHLMNSTNETLADNVTIRVVDTTAPTISASVPDVLWPPNHKMRTVDVDVSASDACGPASWVLESATSDEDDNGLGDGNTDGDVQGADTGTADSSFSLRSERAGPGDGRTYSLVYQATDASGNVARTTVQVLVPHNEE